MPPRERAALWESLKDSAPGAPRALHGIHCVVSLAALALRSALAVSPEAVRGRTLLILTRDPLAAAVALVELDGVARRIVLCPPGVPAEHLVPIAGTAEVDGIVRDDLEPIAGLEHLPVVMIRPEALEGERSMPAPALATEWILLTSGTSGVPKLVVHTLDTLAGAIPSGGALAGPLVWSTYYDIRRYGGLQILLRSVIGGGSLVLADARESIDEFLVRAGALGVTHVTGTPSHWRRALMSKAIRDISPQYARMSGEIADQAIIDRLRATYPQARVAHAFASTEAGVGFEVDDGLEGFPHHIVGRPGAAVQMKIQDDTLHIRSARTALRYLGANAPVLQDAAGYVDTGDVVESRGDRYYFIGRRGGIINVGGLKVHPEEIESVINRHPMVRMSLVRSRKSPFTGAVVVAQVVPVTAANQSLDADAIERLKGEILQSCLASLAPYKVPASIRIVESIDVMASGKLARVDA